MQRMNLICATRVLHLLRTHTWLSHLNISAINLLWYTIKSTERNKWYQNLLEICFSHSDSGLLCVLKAFQNFANDFSLSKIITHATQIQIFSKTPHSLSYRHTYETVTRWFKFKLVCDIASQISSLYAHKHTQTMIKHTLHVIASKCPFWHTFFTWFENPLPFSHGEKDSFLRKKMFAFG